jgi:hypothetical protein
MNNFQPAAQPQFQAPQFTQPYNPPAQAQQQFAQPGPQAQQAPQQPQAARGSLGQGWDQGTRAGGHGPYVKFAQEGSVIAGYVARDMVDGDCRQAREPSKDGTGALKFFRKSGAPQFEFIIALNVQASPEYPDGKATLATSKYRLHSAVVRAMQEQNYQAGEGLREGDYLEVQRIGDVQSGMGQPGHDFVARVTRREQLSGQPAYNPALNTQEVAARTEYSAPVTQTATYGDGNYRVDPTVASAPVAQGITAPAGQTSEAPAITGLSPELAAIVAQYAPGFAQQQQG